LSLTVITRCSAAAFFRNTRGTANFAPSGRTYAAHADLILAGHEHSYERFAPQDPQGHLDPQRGIRQIIVGTGGKSHTLLGFAQPNSEVRNDDTFGVLKLTLSPGKYKWEFVPETGKAFHNSGEDTCHNASPIAK